MFNVALKVIVISLFLSTVSAQAGISSILNKKQSNYLECKGMYFSKDDELDDFMIGTWYEKNGEFSVVIDKNSTAKIYNGDKVGPELYIRKYGREYFLLPDESEKTSSKIIPFGFNSNKTVMIFIEGKTFQEFTRTKK